MSSSTFAKHVALMALVACALVASEASAQVIYEPVQYQYKASQYYYYGGSDPAIHRWAQSPVGGAGRWGRAGGYAFVSGNIRTHRAVVHEPTRAFTDAMPFINAYVYGFTPNDARNEAYFNVPRYFRKGDLLNAAVLGDGAYVVPSQAMPVRIDRDRDGDADRDDDELRDDRRRGATTAPRVRPLMVIPKEQWDRHRKQQPQPKQPQSDKTFAASK